MIISVFFLIMTGLMTEPKKPKKGGAQPGAGRKPKPSQRREFTLALDVDAMLEELLRDYSTRTEAVEDAIRLLHAQKFGESR